MPVARPAKFQSTQPKRAATLYHFLISSAKRFQSTQPKRAATLQLLRDALYTRIISIHAAQEGCDHLWCQLRQLHQVFQSTQPKRAATHREHQDRGHPNISIHAAQEGCDVLQIWYPLGVFNFNPRSPRGLRLKSRKCPHFVHFYFNPRSPRGLRLAYFDNLSDI